MGLGLPPRRRVGAEVGLGPGREDGLAVDIVAVGKRERERRRAADHLAGRVVLGAVARAHVLVLSAVPRHDAAKVGADGVDGVVLERAVLLGDQVVGIALEALDERALGKGWALAQTADCTSSPSASLAVRPPPPPPALGGTKK